MEEIEQKVRQVAWRMAGVKFLESLVRCLFYGLCALAVVAIVEKLFALGLPLTVVFGGVLAGCVPAAIVWTWLSGITRMKAAVLADRHLGLKERLSSALAVADSGEGMAPALREDARRHAQRLDPSRAVRLRLPRQAYYSLIPLLAAVAALAFMPQLDLAHYDRQARQNKAEREAIEKQADNLEKSIKKLKLAAKQNKLKDLAQVVKKMEMTREILKSPKTSRKAAMVQMSKLSEDLRKEQDKIKQLKELKQKLKSLEPCKSKLAQQLADSLKRGDMKGVRDALKKLQDALKKGNMNADQIKQLQRDLQRLTKDIDPEQMAELQKRLQNIADALKKLGIDPNDQKAMDQAFDNLAQLDQELMDIEELLKQLEMLEKALAEGKACLGGKGKLGAKGLGICWGGARPYKGMGSKPGFGPRPMGDKKAVDFKNRKSPVQLQPGKMLGSITFLGQPPKDAEAHEEYTEIVRAAVDKADEVISKREVPAHRKEQVKRYFDSIGQEQPEQEE